MSEPSVIVLTGPSGAGKSTVAVALASRFERAAVVEGDAFRRAVVSGRTDMTPHPSAEALRQLELRYRIAAAAADAYFEEGFNVVLEDVIAGRLVEDVVGMIRSRPLHLVVLLPSADAVAGRDAARSHDGYSHFSVDELHRGFVEETTRIGLWVDSSDQTPEETVDEILRSLVAARV